MFNSVYFRILSSGHFFTVEIHLNNLLSRGNHRRAMRSLLKAERTHSPALFSARRFLTFSVSSYTSEDISHLSFQGRMTSSRLCGVPWLTGRHCQIQPQPLPAPLGQDRQARGESGLSQVLQQERQALSRTHHPMDRRR